MFNSESRLAPATSCYGFNVDLYEVIKNVSKLGFTKIEIMAIPEWFEHLNPETLTDKKITFLQKQLSELGLEPIALSAHTELGKKDGGKLLRERISLAASLNIHQVVFGSGTISSEKEEKNFFQELEKSLEYAEKLDILLSLETGGNYLPNGKKVKKVLERFSSKHLKITYDPANVLTWGEVDPLEDILHVLEDLSHIHIKDFIHKNENHPTIGEGIIDFNRFFKLLFEKDYQGFFSIEIDCFECEMPEACKKLKKSISYLKNKTSFFEWFS